MPSRAPPTPRSGPAIEPYASYVPQRTCDPTAKPGPIGLRDLLDQTYRHHLAGIVGETGGRLRVYRGDDTGNFHPHAEGGTGWDSLARFAA